MKERYLAIARAIEQRFFDNEYILIDPVTNQQETVTGSAITYTTRDYVEDSQFNPFTGGAGSFYRLLQTFIRSDNMVPLKDHVLEINGKQYAIASAVAWPINDAHHYNLQLRDTTIES